MSLTNPNTPVSQQDLQDFYHKLLPYMGASGASALSELSDIDLTDIQDGQILKWDATNNKWVNDDEGGESPTIVTETLLAGYTIVTFTGLPTTGDYLIDFYTSIGIGYTAIDTSTVGQVSLTFNSQSSDVTVYCKINKCGSSVEKKTLNAGETSVTFYSIPTSGNYMMSFYASNGMSYTDINTATVGQVTLSYPVQSSSVTIFCKVEGV